MSKGRIEFANTLRGFAALSVLISHYFGVYWYAPAAVEALIKRPMPTEISVPVYVEFLQFHRFFNWGSFGVALFFVISGFVIPISLGKLRAIPFLRNRVVRIFPTYAVGLIICLIAIGFNLASSGASWPFPLSHVVVHFIPGIRDLLGTTNIDGIIWTLEIEVKFYIVCACLAPLFMRRSAWVFAAPTVLSMVVLLCSQIWQLGFDHVGGGCFFRRSSSSTCSRASLCTLVTPVCLKE